MAFEFTFNDPFTKQDGTGQALAASGNTLKFRDYTKQQA